MRNEIIISSHTMALAIPGINGNAGDIGGIIGDFVPVPGAGTILGGIGDTFSGFLGGSSEKGSGTTKRGTLAWGIDKYEKANDYEAARIAPQAISMKRNGATDREIGRFISDQLGYEDNVYNSHKWTDYIAGPLRSEAATSTTSPINNTSGNVSSGKTSAGPAPWSIIVAVVGIAVSLIFYFNQ